MKANLMKKSLAILMVAALAAGVTACGSTSSDSSSDSSSTTDNSDVTIIISTYLVTDGALENIETYSEIPYEEATGYNIEYQVYSDRASMLVEVAGGGGPDIFDLDGPTDCVEFIEAGQIVDLTDYAAQYDWDNTFMEWAYECCFYQDSLYSLPTCYEGMGMYYNLTVMEENGWEIPTTVDELEALCEEILAVGLVPISFGNANYQGAVDWLYSTHISCYGGVDNLSDVLTGEMTFNENQDIVDSVQQMADWWQLGYYDNNSQSITNDDMVARFTTGDAVMMIDGTWACNTILTDYPDADDWTFELMPAASEGEDAIFPIAIGGSHAINANSDVQDEAAELLAFIYSEANAENHYTSIIETGSQPSPTVWFDAEQLTGMDEKIVELYDTLESALQSNNIGFCSWAFYPAETRTYMNENTDSLFLGMITVEEYLDGAQQYVDEGLEDGTSPAIPELS